MTLNVVLDDLLSNKKTAKQLKSDTPKKKDPLEKTSLDAPEINLISKLQ
jgi:hypothetical protein